jgi:hypothetical protein
LNVLKSGFTNDGVVADVEDEVALRDADADADADAAPETAGFAFGLASPEI